MTIKEKAKAIVDFIPPWDIDQSYEEAIQETIKIINEGKSSVILNYFDGSDEYEQVVEILNS